MLVCVSCLDLEDASVCVMDVVSSNVSKCCVDLSNDLSHSGYLSLRRRLYALLASGRRMWYK